MARIKLRPFAYVGLGVLLPAAVNAEDKAKSDVKPGVAAYVGSEPITVQDLDAKVLKTNMKLAQSLYDARKATLDQVLMERLLSADATAKGVAIDQFIRQRIAEKTKPVTEQEIDAYYKANTAKMGGKPLDQMSAQIRSTLTSQRENTARVELLAQLKEKAGVRITLQPPRAEVPIAANDPVKGPANAKVTIVEFSEFQ